MASSSRLSNKQKLLYDIKLSNLKINDNRIDLLKMSELYSDKYIYPNVSVGYECLKKVPKDKGGNLGNIAYGAYCLQTNESGQYNCALGLNCLYNNKKGSYNVALGPSALLYNINGNGNTAIGNNAGLNIGNNNKHHSKCSNNVAIGNDAMTGNYTNQSECVAIGGYALGDIIKSSKLNTDILIQKCVAIGYATSNYSNGSFNTIIGSYSNYYNTGSNNIILGYETLYSTKPFNTEDSTYIGNNIKPIDKIKNELIFNTSKHIKKSIRGSDTMILGNHDSNNIHMPGLISNNDPKFSELKKGSLYYEEDTGVVKVKLN